MEPSNAPAIVLLGNTGLPVAKRIQALYPQTRILGMAGRAEGADETYAEFGETLRELYRSDTPIIALCAAGIVIRTLAPLLASKGAEPPVLVVAEDGSAVVPLLGGLGGVNRMAREIAALLAVAPAITTSGELRFGTCLLDPPAGYVLADIEQGKRFVSDLLGGEAVRVDGEAPWLEAARLPLADEAQRVIHITAEARPAQRDELLIHPRVAVARIDGETNAEAVRQALTDAGLAPLSLACLVADRERMVDAELAATAAELGVPLRFITDEVQLPPLHQQGADIRLYLAAEPLDPALIGQPRGRLTVVGLGPGAAEFMVPAARQALDEAEDLLGYETYIRMAGPLRPDQVAHCTDNREELQRARHAFELAASGRRVVVVSSGDPGVFAMAAAVLEALDESRAPEWQQVELQVFPGVSAALATAARPAPPRATTSS
jgi:cobalt-precorrin 5A hydrolase/precorrin-3B C17-methyltransferase